MTKPDLLFLENENFVEKRYIYIDRFAYNNNMIYIIKKEGLYQNKVMN